MGVAGATVPAGVVGTISSPCRGVIEYCELKAPMGQYYDCTDTLAAAKAETWRWFVMARRPCSRATVMLTAALLGSDAMAQTEPFREPATLRSQFVSPAVIATWGAVGGALGQDRLRFLVLWRGSTGWLWPGPFGTRGQGIGGTDEPKDPPQSVSQQLLVGKITFGLTVNLRASVVQIEGQEFDLRKSNVFLVDRLDEPDAPRLVRQMWVDPEIPAGDTFEAVIRREPELRAFIRCENTFLDTAQAEVARVLCMRTLDGVVSGR